MAKSRRIVFLTGTRADYGKLKPLALQLIETTEFEVHLFVTGMHLLHKYGATARAVMREFGNVYLYNNQPFATRMDMVLSNTIFGFSSYVSEIEPSMVVVHGDRPEALAGAIVGSFNNILVSHIEGGEISGTIDELIRHSVSKLSHIHFVSNNGARDRLVQLGENSSKIFVIGSPDIDIMLSDTLPPLNIVQDHYNIPFSDYAIAIYHPITTEPAKQDERACNFFQALEKSSENFIIIRPNNDPGCESVERRIDEISTNPRFKVFPSVEFESFLSLLRSCRFIIGNSSAGIREAPVYHKWSINVGSRQSQRSTGPTIINVDNKQSDITEAIQRVITSNPPQSDLSFEFGDGNSVTKFMGIIQGDEIWSTDPQKQFISTLQH